MKKIILLVAAVLGFGVSASATGGTHCVADYKDLKIEIGLTNGRVPGAPVVSGWSLASVEEKGQEDVLFDVKTDLTSWWSADGEIKMIFWKQTEKSDVILKITASFSDVHETFLGTSVYTNKNGVERTEIIACEVE